jgi:hypothetical protein
VLITTPWKGGQSTTGIRVVKAGGDKDKDKDKGKVAPVL